MAKRWSLLFFLACVIAPLCLIVLVLETRSRTEHVSAPDAETAQLAFQMASGLRDLIETGLATERWVVSEAELNAGMAAAELLFPGLNASATIEEEGSVFSFSLGAPHMPLGLWLNAEIGVSPSENGLNISRLQIGRLPLPPGLAAPTLRLALDRAFGAGVGALALEGVAGVRMGLGALDVAFDISPLDAEILLSAIRRSTGAPVGERRASIRGAVLSLHEALGAGDPPEGSVVPVIRATLSGAGTRPEMRDQLLALGIYCGDPRLGAALNLRLPDRILIRENRCGPSLTLGGRDDLKRHFLVSAGLRAIENPVSVLGVGELKELLDSSAGGTGFSFDDMAANAAGLRLAEAFLDSTPPEWPVLLSRMSDDQDVLPPLDGLPVGMSHVEFREAFGDINSAAYRDLMREIDSRVNALPIHRRLGG